MELNDANVTRYVNDLSVDDLKLLVHELDQDFDAALASRFDLSSSQRGTLDGIPEYSKQSLVSALRDLLEFRESGAHADFVMEGLDAGEGRTLRGFTIRITISSGNGWTIKVEIEKNSSN